MAADFKPMLCTLAFLAMLVLSVRADEPAKPGSLVIVGGGTIPDDLRDRFMALAGGKTARLVVIPTASSAADRNEAEQGYLRPWQKYEPASVGLLHTRSREKAESPAFVKPIAEATAVWFDGGDQVRLVAPYRGTAVEREFKALLKRGGVIGGTSAGAAVMSEVMIEGGNPTATVGRGFGFVTNAVCDQHFLRRNRINRLLGVLADRPHLIGLGIDEGTGFILEGDRWSVVGRSYVMACAVGRDGKPIRFETFGDGDHGSYTATGLPLRSPARGANVEMKDSSFQIPQATNQRICRTVIGKLGS
jgi:cyanophycinase